MAWLYSPGLDTLKSVLVLSSETPTEPCVMSSGTLTPRPPSWHGWKTRRWIELLSTTTFPPSMVARGVDSWISSLAASLVKISPRPANGRGSAKGNGRVSGSSSPGSLAKWDPVTSSWKTSAPWPGGDSTSSLEVLPSSGLMLAGSLFERPTWEPPTVEKGSSSSPSEETAWTTPCADDTCDRAKKFSQGGTPLSMQGAQWQTPGTDSFRSRGGERKDEEGLDQQARHWPTPRTISGGPESAERKKELGRENSGGGDLQAAVENWPTPTAKDSDGSGSRGGLAHPGTSLTDAAARNWPTPSARDMKGTDIPNHHGGASLSHFVETGQRSHSLPQDRRSVNSGKSSSPLARTSPLRLNPAFVSWLMGYPWWWIRAERISFAAREMASWTSRQRSLLRFLLRDLASQVSSGS